MKRAQLVSYGTLLRIRQQAQRAFENRNLHECITALERLHRLSPGDPDVLTRLGWIHGLRYDYKAAEKCFEKAIRLAPVTRKAEAIAAAGQYARDFADSKLAEKYLTMALKEEDATPEMFIKLAEFCERRGRMEEAHNLVERALSIDPGSPVALFARAHLQHRAKHLEDAERILRSLLSLQNHLETRVRAWYELGAILDRQGRYEEAMNAFCAAKQLLQREAARHLSGRQMVWKQVNRMRDEVSPAVFKRWHECGRGLQPIPRLVLLGGHPRSGTTLLEQVIDSHPGIVSAEETDLFSDHVGGPLQRSCPPQTPILQFLEAAGQELIQACRRNYFRAAELHLGEPIGTRTLVDKNPSLTMRVWDLVRAFPEISFLIALRDPRDVVLSCFMQPFFPVRQVTATYLDLGTAAEEYATLMGVWTRVAPMLPNPHLEVRYEDMVEDLESVARQVLEFLGLPWDEKVLAFDEHARQKRVRSPTYADVTQKIFTRAVGRWRNYQKYLEPHLAKLEPFVKAFGYE